MTLPTRNKCKETLPFTTSSNLRLPIRRSISFRESRERDKERQTDCNESRDTKCIKRADSLSGLFSDELSELSANKKVVYRQPLSRSVSLVRLEKPDHMYIKEGRADHAQIRRGPIKANSCRNINNCKLKIDYIRLRFSVRLFCK